MADNKTRRIIEVQSDLYQRGRLAEEKMDKKDLSITEIKKYGTSDEVKEWQDFVAATYER